MGVAATVAIQEVLLAFKLEEEAVDEWAVWVNVFDERFKVIILMEVDDVEDLADPADPADSSNSERHYLL